MENKSKIKSIAESGVEYKAGFDPEIPLDVIEKKGISEDVIRYISKKNNEPEDILQFRLDAYHKWLLMNEPHWAAFDYKPINYDDIYFFAKPKEDKVVDEKIDETYKRLGVPLEEQKILKGQAVDAVVDSSSVRTTYGKQLLEMGIIFCPISVALQKYPDLVKKFLAHVVPPEDNFFACLNAAVFSDGTFVYIPPRVKCPIELSSYFRLQTEKLGQFERTLIVADEGSEVSYLEGCSAPIRDTNQLHSGVVELVACKGAKIKYSTVQNWYAGDENGKGGIYNFVTKRGICFDDATISWTQLEVGSIKTWKYPSCILKGNRSKGEFFSVALTNNMQTTDTGTKMIHLGRDTTSTIITKGIALGKSVNGYRGMVKFSPNAENARNFTKCDTLVVGDDARALALPDIIDANMSSVVEHEASVSS
ncbi:MAG: Fe-S cluster assembly protein SufB, partial [Alphaproteobacteria bacterium]|nr:Fe-S cluster assembly protein SufB [Alphaproteobacteria bacterium]